MMNGLIFFTGRIREHESPELAEDASALGVSIICKFAK
jgi:hypothetical protein